MQLICLRKTSLSFISSLCQPDSVSGGPLLQEITAAAANGAKVQFDRVPQDDSAKFKRVALSVAAQQNLASCVAVLKEVAAHYGFTLNIEDGMASSIHVLGDRSRFLQNHPVVEGYLSGRSFATCARLLVGQVQVDHM